jgi:hypothetical protein
MVSVLVIGPKVHGFKSGQGDGFLRAIQIRSTPIPTVVEPRHFPKIILVILIKCRQNRAIAQAVSCRHLTAEAPILTQVSPCGIYGGQSGTGADFSLSSVASPANTIPPQKLK